MHWLGGQTTGAIMVEGERFYLRCTKCAFRTLSLPKDALEENNVVMALLILSYQHFTLTHRKETQS